LNPFLNDDLLKNMKSEDRESLRKSYEGKNDRIIEFVHIL